MNSLSHFFNKNTRRNLTAQELNSFSKIASAIYLGKLANTVGLRKRASKFKVSAYAQAIIQRAGSNEAYNFASIGKTYASIANSTIDDKPFHNKLKKPESKYFMEAIFVRVCNYLSSMTTHTQRGKLLLQVLQEKGLDIDDIVCIDGCYWHVHGELESLFPGVRSRASKTKGGENEVTVVAYDDKKARNAQIGMQTTYSVVSGFIRDITITKGTANEREQVKKVDGKRQLYLMDAGYIDYDMLKNIDACGNYFMIRGKSNMSGSIMDCHIDGERISQFIGMSLNDRLVRDYQKYKNMLLTVRLSNGMTVQIVRVWSKNKGDISFLLTNIANPNFTAKDLACIQKIRWGVELFFKNLKSGVNLRGIKTTFVDLVYSLIYASLIAAMLKYLVFLTVDKLLAGSKSKASMYKIFVASMAYWAKLVNAFITGNCKKLKDVLKKIKTISKLYKMSHQSKQKQEQYKTLDAVIGLLASGACACIFDVNVKRS